MNRTRLSYEIKNHIARVGFGYNNKKSMTSLDEESLKELKLVVDEIEQKCKEKIILGVLFFGHVEGCFLAGADIKLISRLKTESEAASGAEEGQKIYNTIEDLPVPTVACIHGVCLGGGLELALACKQIVASDDKRTMLGLPEVKLGILPGFGGTYRLPRKVGLIKALDLILAGKTLDANRAQRCGLVDGVYPKERLVALGLEHLKKRRQKHSLTDSISDFAKGNFLSRKIVFQKARESVLKVSKGFYEAPLKILELMETYAGKSRESYLSNEAQAFAELCVSSQSKNLRHVFFLMEGAKKYNGPKGQNAVKSLKRGATLGAGTMGGGICWLMAQNNMFPIMKDISYEALEQGLKQSSNNFRSSVKKRKMTRVQFAEKQRSIRGQLNYKGFKKIDLVIEAIVENLDIKKKVFKELEKEVRQDCIVVSNTSSLKVEDMAEAFVRPERFAGLHFFNPVNKMPLVEIVTHSKVDGSVIESLHAWVLKNKKTPVIVKDGPGFLVNRILIPYLNEAGYLLDEGIPMEDLEEACLNFGMPMGPCRLLDEVGIDVAVKVSKILHDGLGPRVAPCNLTNRIVELQCFGRKNLKGFYFYDEQGKETTINNDVQKLLPKKKKFLDEEEIQARVFLPMVNEASIILAEKLVHSPSDLDLALIFGIGFPPFKGGLLRYADEEGPERIMKKLESFAETVDKDRYRPSEFFQKLVFEKRKFYEAFA